MPDKPVASDGGRGAPAGGLGRAWKALTEGLALAGGVLMVAVACMVTASVLMRWLADEGIAGDFEIVQIATALSAFAFLPLCQAVRGNIVVDSFTTWLPQRVRDLLDGLWDLVYAAAALMIAWHLFLGARDSLASGTTSMVRQIPIGYAVGACAAMAVLLGVAALVTAGRRLGGAR